MFVLKVMNLLTVGMIFVNFCVGLYFAYDPSLKERTVKTKDAGGKDALLVVEPERKVPHAPIMAGIILAADVIAAVLMAKL